MKCLQRQGITDLQLVALITTAILDANLLALPRIAAENAGRDGWLSLLLAGSIVMLTAIIVYQVCRRFPNRTLAEFSLLVLGKPLGVLVTSLYIVYTLFLSGITLRLFTEAAKTWPMLWTPQSFFVILLLLAAVNVTRHGSLTLARLCELFFMLSLITIGFLLVPIRRFDFLHLQPMAHTGLSAIASAVPEVLHSFRGFEVLFVLFPLVIHRERVFRIYMAAILAIVILSVSGVVMVFGVVGSEYVQTQVWPLLNYMSMERLQLVERVEMVFLFLWTFQVIGLVAVQYYAGVVSATHLTGGNSYPIWVYTLWLPIYGIAILPHNQYSAFALALVVGLWGEILVLGLSVVILVVAIFRRLDERNEGG